MLPAGHTTYQNTLLPYVCVGGCSAPAKGGPALVTDEAQAVSQTTGRDWVGLSERLAASYSALPQGSSHRIDLAGTQMPAKAVRAVC